MAIYLSRKKGVTPISITPSNANPAALTAYTPVTPTDYGYAIQNYSSVNPISVPVFRSGFIKLNSGAYIVDNMTDLQAMSTPQNIYAGNTYNCNHDGVVVDEIYTATPSDMNPDTLFVDKTYYMNNTGYLYRMLQRKVKIGTATLSTSATTKITCGFKPEYIAVVNYKDSTHLNISIYNEDISSGYTYRGAVNGSNQNCSSFSLPTSSTSTNAAKILSIDSTGFTIDKTSTNFGTNVYYFAIG